MHDAVQKAGDVRISELKLISSENIIFDLRDFLVELNIFEDMFSPTMRGNMLLSDSRNLIEQAPIIGEEYVVVKITTPGIDSYIEKSFRVYKVTDRNIVRDNNTQTFVLHFASPELFSDMLVPIYKSFEGKITDVVERIFLDYISTTRKFLVSEDGEVKESEEDTSLIFLNDTSNSVKFISVGWSPFKCINWLASKSIPKDGVAKNFLFYESNKSFYFGSVEKIFKDVYENKNLIGKYFIAASNIRDGAPSPDLNREYFLAKNVDMIETVDHAKNYTNGYLSNRLLTLDVYNKEYKVIDYDYVLNYSEQYHSSGSGNKSKPIFATDTPRNASSSINFYPVNPKLFTDFKENINEKMGEIYNNRKSSLLDLTNLKLNMTIPGRTDIEVGNMLYFSYPAVEPVDQKTKNNEDSQYSGYYLITAIHHKISKILHEMTLECVKDSLTVENKS